VISLGDSGNYYVATDSNELGVVVARSEEGRVMYPVSWREFRDPVSGKGEARKAAKPF
jgi:exosome complex component CSL4